MVETELPQLRQLRPEFLPSRQNHMALVDHDAIQLVGGPQPSEEVVEVGGDAGFGGGEHELGRIRRRSGVVPLGRDAEVGGLVHLVIDERHQRLDHDRDACGGSFGRQLVEDGFPSPSGGDVQHGALSIQHRLQNGPLTVSELRWFGEKTVQLLR